MLRIFMACIYVFPGQSNEFMFFPIFPTSVSKICFLHDDITGKYHSIATKNGYHPKPSNPAWDTKS